MKQPEESLSAKVQEARPFLRTGIAVLIYGLGLSRPFTADVEGAFQVADKFLDQLLKDIEASE